ncbi:hypothetical protein BKA82DRAFT_1006962 [Pisolithus tinctorius]|uniref:Ribonuclease H1 N-terminal domain-containing protein n=1 Tax=Pisolithus tinctorius Marx 270 TaxID=870435 RepID=A0A0C3NKM9_PISTI|nr:hypothetical protein BKA82DRAFT_1006962 [Pisolithus tinctorius]KIN96215.1 hypothetical protein M404DRAFT_1006962 [Pisolithus tinctorius Marx 270]
MGKAMAYVVTVGTEPGVYDTWIEASWKIRGVQYPVYQGFPTREEAERVFQAALARGEVMAVSSVGGKSRKKHTSTKAAVKQEKSPPSPVSSEISLLMTPNMNAKETYSFTQRGVIPSPPPSPVGRLHRTLRESSISTPPSPSTEVTQHGTVDKDTPSAHVKWISPGTEFGSPLAHSDSVEESPFALMGNRSGCRSPSKGLRTPASSDVEEHELGDFPPQSRVQVPVRGVAYRTLDELVIEKNIDSRIWLPRPVPREFDPAKVKRRPLTRPPSPAKPASSNSSSSFKTPPECSKTKPHISNAESANVRISRGRPSRLTPSLSLPALPLLNCRAFTKTCEQPGAIDLHTGWSPECGNRIDSPQNSSHIQLVRHEDGSQASAFRVHCPPGCLHESCVSSSPLIFSVEEVAKSKYVDVAVSPIFRETQATCNAMKVGLPVTGESYNGDFPCGVDVRSPMARGTQLPFSATTQMLTILGRPTPPTQSPQSRNMA